MLRISEEVDLLAVHLRGEVELLAARLGAEMLLGFLCCVDCEDTYLGPASLT